MRRQSLQQCPDLGGIVAEYRCRQHVEALRVVLLEGVSLGE
jgi:hypothetical protein